MPLTSTSNSIVLCSPFSFSPIFLHHVIIHGIPSFDARDGKTVQLFSKQSFMPDVSYQTAAGFLQSWSPFFKSPGNFSGP